MPHLLASLEDFAAARGVAYDPTDLQALIALEGSSGTVRAYCNRDFTYDEEDEIIVYPRGTVGLVLPEIPVYDVSAVTLIASDSTETDLVLGDWYVDGDSGILYRVSSTGIYPWHWGWYEYPVPAARVQVTYSHGYVMPGEDAIEGVEDLPPELSLAAMSMASRNVMTTASGGQAVRTKTVGSFSVTYGDQSTTVDEYGFTAAERQVLDRYRLPSGP
jgi:hypothetical protein